MHDFRFAFRQLVKSPAFTFAAVLTLALAIGVNSAIFALVHRALLRPTVSDPERVVGIYTSRKGENGGYRQFSHQEMEAVREAGEIFEQVAGLNFTLAGIGRDTESVRRSFVETVSADFFNVFGARIVQGRAFNAAECKPNADIPVVIITTELARRLSLGNSPVGATVRLNGDAFTVVGIAPPGFSGGHAFFAPDAWVPLGVMARVTSAFNDTNTTDLSNPRNYTLNLVGRLAPGLTIESARARLSVLTERLNALMPADAGAKRELKLHFPSRFNISTEPSQEEGVGKMAALLLGLAGVVLLIASLNLANMLLARGAARTKEIAVRLAIGASRGRVVRQLLAEGLLLAGLGGALGVVLAFWANSALLASLRAVFEGMGMAFSFVLDFQPDASVLAATLAFCLVATLIFSLGPALRLTRRDLTNDLKQAAGEFSAEPGATRFFGLRNVLVMAQIALSLALVFCAALFFRGGTIAARLDPGFSTVGGVVAEADFSTIKVKAEDALVRALRVRDRLLAQPGVDSVALATLVPYNNNTDSRRLLPAAEEIQRDPDPNKPQGSSGVTHSITSGYFRTVGIGLVEGRDFTPAETDQPGAPRVVILDEKLAKRLFPNGSAVGQMVKPSQAKPDGSRPEMLVVGVVRNHRHETLGTETHAHLYLPLAQTPEAGVFFHIRLGATAPEAVKSALPRLRRALLEADPDLPLMRLVPFQEIVDRNIGTWVVNVGAVLFGTFGGVALLLAAIGVYGVHAYAVSRRTREIGIRMSLGATPSQIFQLVMSRGALQTGIALALGLVLSLGLGQLLASMLYRVSPFDPLALGGAVVTLSLAALIACFLPARRATRVNPSVALRGE